jgi:hypothetical protein
MIRVLTLIISARRACSTTDTITTLSSLTPPETPLLP